MSREKISRRFKFVTSRWSGDYNGVVVGRWSLVDGAEAFRLDCSATEIRCSVFITQMSTSLRLLNLTTLVAEAYNPIKWRIQIWRVRGNRYVSRFASAFFRRLAAIARLRSRSFASNLSFSLTGSFASLRSNSLLIEIPLPELLPLFRQPVL